MPSANPSGAGTRSCCSRDLGERSEFDWSGDSKSVWLPQNVIAVAFALPLRTTDRSNRRSRPELVSMPTSAAHANTRRWRSRRRGSAAFGWSPEHRLRALTQRRLPNPAESGGLQAKPNIRHPHASSARTPSAPAARTTSRTIRRRHPPPRPTRGPYPRVLPSRRLKRDTNNGALHAPGAATKSSSAGSTSTASPTPSSPKVTSTGTYSRSRTSSSSPNAADSSSEAARVSQASPNANAFAERWIGSVRRECLDRLLIFSRRQLEHALRVYRIHYGWKSSCWRVAPLRELLLGAGDRELKRRRWGCLLPRCLAA
jgi:hypothetical protein